MAGSPASHVHRCTEAHLLSTKTGYALRLICIGLEGLSAGRERIAAVDTLESTGRT